MEMLLQTVAYLASSVFHFSSDFSQIFVMV